MKTLEFLAFDLGASNGRAVSGAFDGERITLTERHRFENHIVRQNGVQYWDALYLLRELKAGFAAYRAAGDGALTSFGIDTWGVDYGLLDANGALLSNPRCYRDSTEQDVQRVHLQIPAKTLFDRTGIASMPFNTVYQLQKRVAEQDSALLAAKTLLFSPDLYAYFLTGEKCTEYTIAATSMLYRGEKQAWDTQTMEALGIPAQIFTEVERAGTLRGRLLTAVAEDCGVERVPYAVAGGHDTASAVAAIPGKGSFAYCSSGTWSVFGVETEQPVLTEDAFLAGFSSEGSVQGGFRPVKTIMGLWLVQECRREWQANGQRISWDDIVLQARQAEPFRSIIDADEAPFYGAGNMTEKIRAYCRRTGQPEPETIGQTARCIYESLALKYRQALEALENIKGRRIDTLHIVGGGIQNRLLNQFAANATKRPVITGPTEGACVGNLLMQAIAVGAIAGMQELREVVRISFATEAYEPADEQAWEDAYGRLCSYAAKDSTR
ncbi:MAG: rhamnulokinase [Eubacteriales bacterium]|nr:rhamnulokinase [Eubacteriales bacterium]